MEQYAGRFARIAAQCRPLRAHSFFGISALSLSTRYASRTLILDYIFAILSLVVALYLVFFEDALHARNEVPNTADLIFAGIAILLLLEITRRTNGFFYSAARDCISHVRAFLGAIYFGYMGVSGGVIPALVVSHVFRARWYFWDDCDDFIYVCRAFCAFWRVSPAFGCGRFYDSSCACITGTHSGRSGKDGGFCQRYARLNFGECCGEYGGSGSLTIPMMKRTGFSPTFSGAVEAAASTGGQLMPPIMGAGAFIMSQWTQIPYLTIVAVSFIPALIYFLSVTFFIHFRARKRGIVPLSASEVPDIRDTIREGWHFAIPIVVLVGTLIYGFTPTFAAATGTASIVVASWLNKNTRMHIRDVVDALALGAHNMITTGIILLCAGIIVGVVLMVGVGIKFSLLISAIAGSSVLITVVLIAIASLILGMGLPVTASYIVLAVLAAPALTNLGVSLIAAHLLIFWYSQDANVTPPVCLAAYSAAGIAGANPLRTGFESWRIAKGIYFIPLLFLLYAHPV